MASFKEHLASSGERLAPLQKHLETTMGLLTGWHWMDNDWLSLWHELDPYVDPNVVCDWFPEGGWQ
jgi:hypothetical protein